MERVGYVDGWLKLEMLYQHFKIDVNHEGN